MSAVGYVIAGYGATALAVGLYVARILRRARRVVLLVEPEHRRWM